VAVSARTAVLDALLDELADRVADRLASKLGAAAEYVAEEELVTLLGTKDKIRRLIKSGALQVTQGDIFTWAPPRTRWDTIYFDIWGDVSSDDLREMRQLHNRFRSKLRPKGWMASWMFNDLQKGWM
jgi:hypothetical protein